MFRLIRRGSSEKTEATDNDNMNNVSKASELYEQIE